MTLTLSNGTLTVKQDMAGGRFSQPGTGKKKGQRPDCPIQARISASDPADITNRSAGYRRYWSIDWKAANRWSEKAASPARYCRR